MPPGENFSPGKFLHLKNLKVTNEKFVTKVTNLSCTNLSKRNLINSIDSTLMRHDPKQIILRKIVFSMSAHFISNIKGFR